MLSFYRRLLRLRRASPALRVGSYRTIPAPRGVFAYVREAPGERVMIALNFVDRPSRVAIAANADVLLSTSDGRTGDTLQRRDRAGAERKSHRAAQLVSGRR
ncbi:MAG: alpha-glucosidase C-terminal domain-containing protein [Chloroflexota bacterium]|nr:alpha-glucosidase C-terminal domain-containing protein [Chloroflexota bacterium]